MYLLGTHIWWDFCFLTATPSPLLAPSGHQSNPPPSPTSPPSHKTLDISCCNFVKVTVIFSGVESIGFIWSFWTSPMEESGQGLVEIVKNNGFPYCLSLAATIYGAYTLTLRLVAFSILCQARKLDYSGELFLMDTKRIDLSLLLLFFWGARWMPRMHLWLTVIIPRTQKTCS